MGNPDAIPRFRIFLENARRYVEVSPGQSFHPVEIYKEVHGLLPAISNRFAGKVRKPVGSVDQLFSGPVPVSGKGT